MRMFTCIALLSFISCSNSVGGKENVQELASGEATKFENFGEAGSCGYDKNFWTEDGSGFTDDHYEPQTTQKKYLTSPSSPDGGCFSNYFIKSGSDETIPFRLYKKQQFSEIYIEFYLYFKSGFSYPGGLKLLRLGQSSQKGPFLFLEYNFSNGNPDVVFYTYDTSSDTTLYTGGFPYRFPENTWIKIGVYHKESSPNNEDGESILYINDAELARSGPSRTRTGSTTKDFFWVGGNHSWGGGSGEGGGRVSSGDSNMYIDAVKVMILK